MMPPLERLERDLGDVLGGQAKPRAFKSGNPRQDRAHQVACDLELRLGSVRIDVAHECHQTGLSAFPSAWQSVEISPSIAARA
jgi:hypothetical protein